MYKIWTRVDLKFIEISRYNTENEKGYHIHKQPFTGYLLFKT